MDILLESVNPSARRASCHVTALSLLLNYPLVVVSSRRFSIDEPSVLR